MKTLILRPGRQHLDYGWCDDDGGAPHVTGRIARFRSGRGARTALNQIQSHVMDEVIIGSFPPDVVAVQCAFGGSLFPGPAVVNSEVLHAVKDLVHRAPIHMSGLVELLQALIDKWPGFPVVLVFETSFFTQLPRREYFYGLDTELTSKLQLRRYGCHGICHEAACADMTRLLQMTTPGAPARILSICLERRPEIAAVIGQRPVMVTSGVTPLEGLPGETMCGDIDPNIVLTLANRFDMGPEQVNQVLTSESGVRALAGRKISLDDLFTSTRKRYELARRVFKYRLLLACGAGIAAMGGLDAIVFSGCNMQAAGILGPWLADKLRFAQHNAARPVAYVRFDKPMERIVADSAATALLATRGAAAA